MKSILIAALLGLGLSLSSVQARPVFLGPTPAPNTDARPRTLVYMTAEQMAARVQALTGFYQPGFADFARIIGTYDPKIGSRTNDRPTALTVLIMNGLLREVASSVVAREIFLDPADRLIFRGIDLSELPDAEQLRLLTQRLCQDAFAMACPSSLEDTLDAAFRAESGADLSRAWTNYLGLFLQNGALFYL